MSHAIRVEILAALKKLDDEPEKYLLTGGICYYVWDSITGLINKSAKIEIELQKVFVRWSKFSGVLDYPVPHPMGAKTGFDEASDMDELWLGKYGRDRKELLEFLIKEFEIIVERGFV